MNEQSILFTKRRFLPYFCTQALGAFNDNIFKNVLLLLVAFAAPGTLFLDSNLIINLAAGLFILPFFLFSASAGLLADKYEKSWLIRRIKLAEVAIMLLAGGALFTESYSVLLLLLFLMGTQSAFFGPVKYALLPQHLNDNELVPGNALVEAGTFLAILSGTLLAGLIADQPNAHYIAAVAVIVFSMLGYLISRAIPEAPASDPGIRFAWRPIKHTGQAIQLVKENKTVYSCILAISWFWFLGASYLTQFAQYTKLYLGGNASAVSVLLALFSVGIALGSLLCDRLSGHRIEPGIVPLGSLGLTVFGADLLFSTPSSVLVYTDIIGFICNPALMRVYVDLLMIGISGGLFIVPLYAMMQKRAKREQLARTIAVNNIINAIFMVVSAIAGMILLGLAGVSIPLFFFILAVINAFVALYIFRQVPEFMQCFTSWIAGNRASS
ncbi:MFS transporter [Photobacterium chitinilyticum]|uniref:MFS transporter n=1 Tax=Photobacterium chitinilyticum TaxID=2485123 RepID=A0A444JK04_9GAMM|nr:MFS transporter [Photobacterium chitinilyticum]